MNELIGSLIQVIGLLVSLVQTMLGLEPSEEYQKISIRLIIAQIGYVIVDCITRFLGIYLIFSILRFTHNYPWIVAFYIGIVALLPPLKAHHEKKRCDFQAKDYYALANGLFNALGAAAAILLFALARSIIPDFNVLKRFQLEIFVSLCISMSLTLALLYQSAEQKMNTNIKKLDHDPGIQWRNQRLNMLHLFNAYFFPTISAVYIIAYSIYCKIYNIRLVMQGKYIAFLLIALIYFFLLSMHPYEYLYKIFLITTPAILITMTYWMSWFEKDKRMIYVEAGSIIISLILFAWRVLSKVRMPSTLKNLTGFKSFTAKLRYIRPQIFLIAAPTVLILLTCWMSRFVKDKHTIFIEAGCIVAGLVFFSWKVLSQTQLPSTINPQKGFKGFITKSRYILAQNMCSFFILFIAIVAYLFIVLTPLTTERINFIEAENYIYAICREANLDAEPIIEKSRELYTYDAGNKSYDKMDYMDFINKALETEIKTLHIIEGTGLLEYNELETWYKNIPFNR